MSDDNVQAVRRVLEAFNTGDLAPAEEYIAEDFVDTETPGHEAPEGRHRGLTAFAATVWWLHDAFPDLRLEEQEVIASGDIVVVRALMSGTQRGEFMGIPPRGKHIASRQLFIFHLSEGKVTGYRVFRDDVSIMMQLGAIHLVSDEPSEAYGPGTQVYEY